jgi:threonyl-tRNA synthetase
MRNVYKVITGFYKAFGMSLRVRLSVRDPEHPEKYLGNKDNWDKAEKILKEIAAENNTEYYEAPGEASFYAPKLDFMAKDSIGREWQVATIQLDVNMPERFDLFCMNEKGERERIVMLHAAIMGAIERFLSVLIEHIAGAFPLWLSRVQVKVIPVRTTHNEYATKIAEMLREKDIRVDLDSQDENLGIKVRDAKNNKIPYWIVIGDKEIEAGKVTLESRDHGNLGQMSKEDLLTKFMEEIKNKK